MIFCSRSETVAVWLSEDSILQSRALYFFSFLVPTISLRRVQRLTLLVIWSTIEQQH
jgi:hypothetical protein